MRVSPLVLICALLAGSLSVSVSRHVAAHQFKHPKTLRVGVKSDALLISITHDVNPGRDALQLRGLFDRNADGKIDTAEAAQLVGYLEKMATLHLRVTVNGEAMSPKVISREGFRVEGDAKATRTVGVGVLLRVSLPKSGRHEIRIEDWAKDPRLHVPATVDVADGWTVGRVSSGKWRPKARRIDGAQVQKGRPLVFEVGSALESRP